MSYIGFMETTNRPDDQRSNQKGPQTMTHKPIFKLDVFRSTYHLHKPPSSSGRRGLRSPSSTATLPVASRPT